MSEVITIKNKQDMLDFLHAKSEKEAQHHMFKYTSCGAWIEFHKYGIMVGSIVEGSDVDCEPFELLYPFGISDYDRFLEELEWEADVLWKKANPEFNEFLNGED